MNWLKRNYYVVILVASLVALSLIIVPVYNTIDALMDGTTAEYRTLLWMNLLTYTCIAVAEVLFVILASRRYLDKLIIMLAILLFFISDIVFSMYRIFEFKEFSHVYYILIDVAIICLMVMSLTNRRYLLATLVVILMEAATSLLGTFNGSGIEFSKLILDFVLMSAIYFYSTNAVTEAEYNTYS